MRERERERRDREERERERERRKRKRGEREGERRQRERDSMGHATNSSATPAPRESRLPLTAVNQEKTVSRLSPKKALRILLNSK
jgi:ribosome assembly protein YihI (activator of Der GTPase)